MTQNDTRTTGTDHIKETEGVPPLSENQAKEQLKYELRNQLGTLTFRTMDTDRPDRDGIVIAEINGEQVDHYLYADT